MRHLTKLEKVVSQNGARFQPMILETCVTSGKTLVDFGWRTERSSTANFEGSDRTRVGVIVNDTEMSLFSSDFLFLIQTSSSLLSTSGGQDTDRHQRAVTGIAIAVTAEADVVVSVDACLARCVAGIGTGEALDGIVKGRVIVDAVIVRVRVTSRRNRYTSSDQSSGVRDNIDMEPIGAR